MKYLDKDGKDDWLLYHDCAEKDVWEVAKSIMKNEPFLCLGIIIQPSSIRRIIIFESEKKGNELVLPDGTTLLEGFDSRKDYFVSCIIYNEVKGVRRCTKKFIAFLPEEGQIKTPTKPLEKKEVFIVHGRDETQALRLQKYLNRNLEIKAKMFEDFKEESVSRTIIEQLEYIKDNVGYAFVIVTPDDLGCLRENIDKCRTNMLVGKTRITVKSVCEILDNLHKRARQNVVFEHGLFIGALGRDRVCCLLQKDVKEKPSDIDGILYVSFIKSVKDTFTEIAQKLKKAGLVKT